MEQTIGKLKRKFPVLTKGIAYDPEVVTDIIKACCFLWNYGILSGANQGFNPDLYIVEDKDELDANLDPTEGGRVQREKVAAYLWQHKNN